MVDPGPADEGHLARIAEHGPIGLILITHGHPDHTEGAARLSELLGGVHVLAVDPAHTIGGEPLTEPGEHLGGSGLEHQPVAARQGTPPTRSASWSSTATSGWCSPVTPSSAGAPPWSPTPTGTSVTT